MNVLRLTPHYYFESDSWPSRFDSMGGMQVQITIQSKWLAEKNINQDVLTTGFPAIKRHLKFNENLNVYSVRCLTLPFKSKYHGTVFLDQSWSLGVIRWVLKNLKKKKYDCIHVHASGVAWPLVVANVVSKLLGNIPIVLTIHCSRNFTYEPMSFMDAVIHPWVKRIEKKMIKKCEKVVVLTDRVKEQYEKMFLGYDKFVTVSDCIAPFHQMHHIGPCCERTFQRLGIPMNKRSVLFVGRVAHEKGWDIFVDVVNRINHKENILFLVVGDGPQKDEMCKKFESYGLSNQYIVTGFISHELVPCLMSKASLLIMPSRHEELGGTALEAITAGIPIVVSAIGGLKNTFRNGDTAFLHDPTDIDGFAKSVNEILEHEEVGAKLVENARTKLLTKYTAGEVLSKYITIYDNIEQKNKN